MPLSADVKAAGLSQQSNNYRDQHLFGPGPKRVLALDGGGVRGAITVAFLERIEEILCDRFGKDFRLGHWFDLVGGTSTGALIAGALALGYRAKDISGFYTDRAAIAFRRPRWRIPLFQAKFDTLALRREINLIVRERELESNDLITGLCVVTKRMDTGSPWIVANNPQAPYWETPKPNPKTGKPDFIGNRYYKLANLVRASTAAPHFFDPEMLPIVEDPSVGTLADVRATARANPWFARFMMAAVARLGLKRETVFNSKTDGLFVDGGVTPHNNPSLALFQMTQLKPYRLCWPTGPERLSVVSIGTGTHRPRLDFANLGFGRFPKLAFHSLLSLMNDSEVQVLTQMQWLGECLQPWTINSEIGALRGDTPPGGKMFRFLRYDVKLELDWLREELGFDGSEEDVIRYRCMDDPGIIPKIYKLAQDAAKKQVKPEHWAGDLPGWCNGAVPTPPEHPPLPKAVVQTWWSKGGERLAPMLRLLGNLTRNKPLPPADPT